MSVNPKYVMKISINKLVNVHNHSHGLLTASVTDNTDNEEDIIITESVHVTLAYNGKYCNIKSVTQLLYFVLASQLKFLSEFENTYKTAKLRFCRGCHFQTFRADMSTKGMCPFQITFIEFRKAYEISNYIRKI